MLCVISRSADDPLGVMMMLLPLMSPYLENLSATASLSSGIPAVGPYLLSPAVAAAFIPSMASMGGARSGSPSPRLMESGPARSNIFLIPDMGTSEILLEIFMGDRFPVRAYKSCGSPLPPTFMPFSPTFTFWAQSSVTSTSNSVESLPQTTLTVWRPGLTM